MIITKKCLPRRAVLRSLGATIALPLLDAMAPALTAMTKTAAKPVRRLGVLYVPNGIMMQSWTPAVEGTAFEFTPILQSLTPLREYVLVLSGLANKEADAKDGEGAGDHSRAPATFLTGVHPRKTEGRDIQAGISMDQIVARDFGRETQLASLELTLESNELVGACDPGYSCAYSGTVSWRNSTTPLPPENDPRALFERLFGASRSTDSRARAAQIRKDRSILDSVSEDVGRLRKGLSSRDRVKMTQYLEAIRDVERRIQRAEEQSSREVPVVEQPAGIPDTYERHAQLMFDLLALAFQCDLTRVFTLMMARELSNRTYPECGVADPHHAMSHHQNDTEKMLKVTKINAYHVKLFADFLEKLRSTADGDGSLLDHSLIVYGSGISDGDRHDHVNLPVLLVGGAATQMKGGRHLRFSNDTPLMNLHVTVLDKMGIPLSRFGDSTGTIDLPRGSEPFSIG